MSSYLSILKRHQIVRASAAAIFFYGFAGAATSPYQSVIGIRELGLSNNAYAVIALLASVANVISAITIGILSDRFQSYRRPLILITAFGVASYFIIWAVPDPVVFALVTIGPMAMFHASNSMLFGNVRAQAGRFAPEEAAEVNALMRTMISLAWVLVPGAVGIALTGRASMMPAYLIAAGLAACCLATVLFWMEPDRPTSARPPAIGTPETDSPETDGTRSESAEEGGTGTAQIAPSTGRPDRPAQVRLPHTRPAFLELGQILAPGVVARLISVALISSVLTVNGTVLPLIVTGTAGGKLEDIGLIVGLVAALEVVFMIFWAQMAKRMRLTTALCIGSGLYFVYLAGLALATEPWHVYAVSVIAGFSAAAIISLPISFLLDMIRDRPGLSASLIAVNMFLGGAIGAGIFALGSALGGYHAAALLGGAAGILGALALLYLERERQ
jgi:MFS transporter, SET family, sugar efflux transporter